MKLLRSSFLFFSLLSNWFLSFLQIVFILSDFVHFLSYHFWCFLVELTWRLWSINSKNVFFFIILFISPARDRRFIFRFPPATFFVFNWTLESVRSGGGGPTFSSSAYQSRKRENLKKKCFRSVDSNQSRNHFARDKTIHSPVGCVSCSRIVKSPYSGK